VKSEKLFNKAIKIFPGGVNSPVRYYSPYPRFIKGGKGQKIWDVDGNFYDDYVLAYGPLILGHANKTISRAIAERSQKGTMFGAPTEEELKLGEIISKSAELDMLRFVNSGGEATYQALRLSRFVTKRKKILKVKGGYHGTHDFNYPGEFVKEIDFNDSQSLKNELSSREYAAFILEPVMGNVGVVLPQDGYLQDVREYTEKFGTIYISDEVITGFRTKFGIYSDKYEPDLVTLGKIIGGGTPLAAYGGKEELMKNVKPAGEFKQAGTYSGNPLSVTAGLAALRILSRKDYGKLNYLSNVAAGILEKSGVRVNMVTGMLSMHFSSEEVTNYSRIDLKLYYQIWSKLFPYVLNSGIFIAPSPEETMFISFSHTLKDITRDMDIIAGRVEEIWKS